MSSFNKATDRIHALEQERKNRLGDVERRRDKISTDEPSVANFAAPSFNNALLATHTVGLVSHRDFKERREQLEIERERQEKVEAALQHSRNRRTLEKRKRANRAVLSFRDDDDSDSNSNSDSEGDKRSDKRRKQGNLEKEEEKVNNQLIVAKRRRLGKDPSVDTQFLPDRDRERAERTERERLRLDWERRQRDIKSETIRITYSFWDGSGHRRTLSCTKGTTIGRFLALVQPRFKQLRNASADGLMFIKEDLIIPHHYSFYDFVIMRARGKSGPLFNFAVVEDVRVVADAAREKEDAHASKVVERRWYDRNKHIFPASRWELFDPTKKYDRYTIHGD